LRFLDRVDAGKRLGEVLSTREFESTIVVGLPRGGVPVAFEVARRIGAPLDVIVVRKLGVPAHPEVAMGAISEGGIRVIDHVVVASANVTTAAFAKVEQRERTEFERRIELFRKEHRRISLVGKTVIVVDDGIATGSTARAACQVAAAGGAIHVVLAVPVAPHSAVIGLADVTDEIVCLATPEPFSAVGKWYADFAQTSDEEVVDLLRRETGIAS